MTSPAIDLSAAVGVELSFWQRYVTEATYDFCHVEVSANNGATWTELAAYDGTQTTWTRAVFLVPQLDGALQAKVRFRLTSDVRRSRPTVAPSTTSSCAARFSHRIGAP